MKSLNFQKLNITGADVLTRLQMKKIVGGHSDGNYSCVIEYTDDTTETVSVSAASLQEARANTILSYPNVFGVSCSLA